MITLVDLTVVRAYLEAYSIEILNIRELKNNGMPVITIDGKIPAEGVIATFQYQPWNNILYRMRFHPKAREFISFELVFQFST